MAEVGLAELSDIEFFVLMVTNGLREVHVEEILKNNLDVLKEYSPYLYYYKEHLYWNNDKEL